MPQAPSVDNIENLLLKSESFELDQAEIAKNLERDLGVLFKAVTDDQAASVVLTHIDTKSLYSDERLCGLLLAPLARTAADRWKNNTPERADSIRREEPANDDETLLPLACRVYGKLSKESMACCHILTWMGWRPKTIWQDQVIRFFSDDAPENAKGIPLFFSPLIKRDDLEASRFFPQIFAGIAQLDLGTAVIDYSNYLYRNRDVRPHPAASRLEPLAGLLATVTQQLLSIEEAPSKTGQPAAKVSQIINDSVGLITALCDALSLVGDKSIVGKIFPCLGVKHRRVKLEAAAALARLGEEDGKELLIQLASESVVRRRVVSYATELGFESEIDEKFKTEAAFAESELALWLASPTQMGVAPYKMELVDQKRQFWPGFEEPVDCFLMKYVYPIGETPYENIGIVGPITHSFSVSLTDLPSEDVYAVFAGWQVKHDEIFASDVQDASPHQQGVLSRLRRKISDQSLEIQSERLLGNCFDKWVLVCRGKKSNTDASENDPATDQTHSPEGWIAADLENCYWLPDEAGFHGFDASLAWYHYLGRSLLEHFNPSGSEPSDDSSGSGPSPVH